MPWYQRFVPELTIKHYRDLDIEGLRDWGCKLLLLDIDNTLVPYDVPLPDEAIAEFIGGLHSAGITVILISNNRAHRVKTFAQELGLEAYHFAKKPLALTYRKIMRTKGLEPGQVVCLGDQLLTDIWGAHNAGCRAIWARPLVKKDLFSTRFNRVFERLIIRKLQKEGCLDETV